MMQLSTWEQVLSGSVRVSDRVVTLFVDGEIGAGELESLKDELFRLAHRQCVQDDLIDERVDGGGGANAERQ